MRKNYGNTELKLNKESRKEVAQIFKVYLLLTTKNCFIPQNNLLLPNNFTKLVGCFCFRIHVVLLFKWLFVGVFLPNMKCASTEIFSPVPSSDTCGLVLLLGGQTSFPCTTRPQNPSRKALSTLIDHVKDTTPNKSEQNIRVKTLVKKNIHMMLSITNK